MTAYVRKHRMTRWALVALLALSFIACDDEPSTNGGADGGGMVAGEIGGEGGLPQGGEAAGAGVEVGGAVAGGAMMGGVMTGGAVMGGQNEGGMMGGTEPVCIGSETYGLLAVPSPLAFEGEGMKSAPQLVALPDGSYQLAWLGEGEQGSNYLHLQRLDEGGAPQGSALVLGRAKGGQYRVHATSTGVTTLWINQRSELISNESVYLQSFDLAGAPRMEAQAVSGTFGVSYLSSAWEDAFGGVVMFGSSTGLEARAFAEVGVATDAVRLSSDSVRSPTLIFGGGSFAALWSVRDESGLISLHFQLLSESAEPIGETRSWDDTRAQGSAKLVYGNGSYAMAWSMPDPTVLGGQGRLVINLRLMDETGGELGLFTLNEGEGSMQLSDLTWLSPGVFMSVWHAGSAGNSSVGLSRINAQGQVLAPVIYSSEGGALLAEAKVIGAASKATLVMTMDPSPQPTGLFSPETRVSLTPVGPCE